MSLLSISVVEELHDQRLVPAELVVELRDLGGGATGTGLDGPRAAGRGVHQQEADEDCGEHRDDREGQPTGDVGEHADSSSA